MVIATIRDVAKLAKVSVATVSRVINNKGYVSEQSKKKVANAIKELQYKPNEIARGLSNKSYKVIALIIPTIDNPFFSKLAKSSEDFAYSKGYKLFLCNTNNSRDRLKQYLETIKYNLIDGVIISSEFLYENDLKQFSLRNIPIVTIDRTLESDFISSISVNNRKGAQVATKHLLEIGCEKIGHLRGPDNVKTSNDRYLGYKDVVEKFDWYDMDWNVLVKFSVDDGFWGMKDLLRRHEKIDAVFASNDLIAIGAMKAAIEAGYKIPDEIAIIGFDGISMTEIVFPKISTMEQPVQEIGRIAVQEIIDKVSNSKETSNKYILDTKLIQRDSTLR